MSPILNHNQTNSKMSMISITSGPANGHSITDKNPGIGNLMPDKQGVVLQGYLKKLKTMKKKYFVLLSDSGDKTARLEYYDSEKKFRSRFGQPKRSIVLKSCFHINRRLDTKQKFVIALYTKDDSFCVVLENEADLNKWLKALLALHRVEETEVDVPRTNFGKFHYFLFFFLCTIKVSFRKNERTMLSWAATYVAICSSLKLC